MTADLKALLARVEAAEGPDRELDRRIWKATGQGSIRLVTGLAMMGGRTPGRQTAFDSSGHKASVPRYTASLDAALAICERVMVPALLDVEGSWEPTDKGVCPAWTVRWYPPGKDRDGKSWWAQVGSGRTPALALIAALLKALILQAGSAPA